LGEHCLLKPPKAPLNALEVTKRLGLEDKGGMVRVGPVHYNTVEEIKRFGEVLVKIAGLSFASSHT
jgi:selenocysteine lyase/cysteine desulfurase